MIHVILLSGGSGTRLWPLSNEARSKQFLKVLRDQNGNPQSMVQRTFEMLERVQLDKTLTVATHASQVQAIEAQLPRNFDIVVEPERRDTAPAIMLACAYLASETKAKPNDTVVVMPIDAFAEESYYEKIRDVHSAIQADSADIVLLGVRPEYPSEKYGYIVPSEQRANACAVSHFIEKPNAAAAQELIDDGAFWNCGVFGFKLKYLNDLTKRYIPFSSFQEVENGYASLPKNSFDYEVVEKTDSIAMTTFAGSWKDLGTWNTLSEEMAVACSGRSMLDESTCRNVHAINELNIPLVVLGLKDAIVAATPDGILVSDKAASAYMKSIVEKAAEKRPMCETRQWGEYKVLDYAFHDDGYSSLEKLLMVKAGKQLSYQLHRYRSEVWTIVDGTGQIVLDGAMQSVARGSVVSIRPGIKHAVLAETTLSIIEVQCGTMLEEEDIERFGFWW